MQQAHIYTAHHKQKLTAQVWTFYQKSFYSFFDRFISKTAMLIIILTKSAINWMPNAMEGFQILKIDRLRWAWAVKERVVTSNDLQESVSLVFWAQTTWQNRWIKTCSGDLPESFYLILGPNSYCPGPLSLCHSSPLQHRYIHSFRAKLNGLDADALSVNSNSRSRDSPLGEK